MMIGESKKSAVTKLVFISAVIFCAMFFGRECSDGALKGIYFCAEVLVPSLFPFMAAAAFVAESGLSRMLGKHLEKPTTMLFGLSGSCAAIILLSLFGGYPVGARGIRTLYENGEINAYEAKKCSYFAVGAGPGFLITFVGVRLLDSSEAGACILAAQIISVIILGVANKYIFREKQSYNSNSELRLTSEKLSNALVKAVESGTYGCIEMCGMVVMFSAFNEVTTRLLADNSASTAANILLEVTTACNLLSSSNNILLIAFAVGFGGLCVHFQVFQALGSVNIKQWIFFLYRIIQGLLTTAFTFIFIRLFRVTLPVFSGTGEAPALALSTSLLGSVMLMLTGLCFIYNIFRK